MSGSTVEGLCPISRRYPQLPIPGVGGLVFDDIGRVLLIQRGGEPLKGYWSIPGGVLETGEYLEDAVRREMLEETGLIVEPIQIITIFERILRDAEERPEYHYVIVDYLCRLVSGTAQAGSDAAAVGWYSKQDIETLRLTEGAAIVIDKAYRIIRNEADQFGTTRV